MRRLPWALHEERIQDPLRWWDRVEVHCTVRLPEPQRIHTLAGLEGASPALRVREAFHEIRSLLGPQIGQRMDAAQGLNDQVAGNAEGVRLTDARVRRRLQHEGIHVESVRRLEY
jgi:hypothetical protein